MSSSPEKKSSMLSWVKLLLGIAAGCLAFSLVSGATAWWEFANATVAALFGVTMITVGVRDFVKRQRRIRAGGETAGTNEQLPS